MVKAVTSFGRSGVADWLIQRVSGVVLLAYLIVVGGYLVMNGSGLDYATWKGFFDSTFMKVFSTAAVLSVVSHAWIGLWAVSTDYLTERLMGGRGLVLRLAFQAASAVVLFTYLVWGMKILWG
ncbi:succinate dehydrogenase, hydrophobic membrane anchor protein [Spongiibacter taiwanensis]|uniref:succinate dehydrogenase, hydrophobic membrane anchor protein n=1 Tax=Spongiibacter taiwanensis TaxID=1748242 RepID=UPI0020358869|nr:succinate dehydrogenase, hydrophobic membrane anchor protein [Spongiibacter taiwanensis]USA43268.1 succinate dehydrogenase, hydrophobic membrane anchor protein [Spongiibacter taiwanensis]